MTEKHSMLGWYYSRLLFVMYILKVRIGEFT